MCVIQSADRPIRLSKEMPDILILYTELAVKAGAWCAQISSGELAPSSVQRGSVVKVDQVQLAVTRLASTLFEAVVEVCLSVQSSTGEEPVELYLTVESPMFEEPLEGLISTSFELARVLNVSIMRSPLPLSLEDEELRKCCLELLNLIARLVHHFRRQVDNKPSETRDVSQDESLPGSRRRQWPTALRVVSDSVQSLTELGKLSTSTGEVNVGLFNFSWKGLTNLLQVVGGRDIVASVIDIPSIVATLLSNAVQQSKAVVGAWLLNPLKPSEKDPRKQCVANRFLLGTAGKISSFYPQHAVKESRSMVSCAIKVYACLLQKDHLLKAALEAFAELVVPSAFALLQNSLTHKSVHEDLKIQILRYITLETHQDLERSHSVIDCGDSDDKNNTLEELFCNKPGGLLKTGRMVLFLSVLRSSSEYSAALLTELLAQLPWLLDGIPEEGMYVLMTRRVYLPDEFSDLNGKWKWQLMYTWVSQAMKVFAVVAAKQEHVWREFQYFLFEHVLHPSELCGELVLDVWCFVIGQSDEELARDHLEVLLNLLRELVVLKAEAPMQRRIARAVCMLLRAAPETVTSQVADSLVEANPFKTVADAEVIALLVQEVLSLSVAGRDGLISSCIACGKGIFESVQLENRGLESKLGVQKSALTCLSTLLSQSCARKEVLDAKYIQEIKQLALNLISTYTLDRNNSRMFHNLGLIAPTLGLCKPVQDLFDPGVYRALLPRLLECVQTTPDSSQSRELKQPLADFLASLGDVDIVEEESNPAMQGLYGLYHFLLKEQYWPVVHMGLQSIGQFAAHSSINDLFKLVPPNATAAWNAADDDHDDAFQAELLDLVEKRNPILSLEDSSGKQLQLLRAEASLQQQKHKATLAALRKYKNSVEIPRSTAKGDDGPAPASNSEIQEAMALLSKGLGVLKEKAPEMQNSEASREWEALRARLAEMNEQVKALQRRTD